MNDMKLRSNPATCPRCGQTGIRNIGDYEQVSKTSIAFGRTCSKCDNTWYDIFQLVENRTDIH